MTRFLLLIVFVGGIATSAFAAKTKPAPPSLEPAAVEVETEPSTETAPAKPSGRITGIYSTLKSLGGDEEMIGMEVIIVRSREGFRAFVQTADGLPAAPVLVPVSVDGATVVFTVPATTGEPLEFKGKATRQGLTGTLGDRQVTLPRRKSYWQ